MVRIRNRARVSDSVQIGRFRFRLSEPLGRRGRGWGSVRVRAGRRGWFGFGAPFGGARGRKRR
jgi:hypothetical protein